MTATHGEMPLKETEANSSSVRTGTDNFPDNRSEKAATERTGGEKILSENILLREKVLDFYNSALYESHKDSIRGLTKVRGLLQSRVRQGIFDQYNLEEENLDQKEYLDSLFHERKFAKEFLSELDSDSVVADVGAYKGFYSLIGSQKKSYSFEIDPEHVEDLKSNYKLNPETDVEIVQKAVSNVSEDRVSFESGNEGRNRINHGDKEIETVTLDDFFLNSGTDIPDILKVDVEGAEHLVLEGAELLLEKHHPVIFLEIHLDGRIEEFGSSKAELTHFLVSKGYSVDLVQKRERDILVVAR